MQTFDTNLIRAMAPEILLCAVACVLFLLGVSSRAAARRIAPVLAVAALVVVFLWQAMTGEDNASTLADRYQTFRVFQFATYIKMLTAGVGVLFVLLSWPTNREATGNSALEFGADAGEFFGLMLLSIAGVMLVAGANDMILLFLGLELASIPTYILVSISRPLPVAQEAGVKYFFLGAMSAAVMLFGFSYLYGTTGTTSLHEIATRLSNQPGLPGAGAPTLTNWQQLAVAMLVAGFAFKIAAFPLHFYAGDVYQGAATPITAFLSFVPKTSGFVALIKLAYVVSGGTWESPAFFQKLLWVMAVLTMTAGNVLGLLQFNVKRVLAYSSIAHTGYMLVGLTAYAVSGAGSGVKTDALRGVLFYLAGYGIMNAGAFGVLMLLPTRTTGVFRTSAAPLPATSAETYEDLAGTGRRHVGLGLAMAVCCFSLIGLPLTVGFFGKLFLIRPALDAAQGDDRTWMIWLVVITMLNAAISAAYYLRIIGTMFLRPEPTDFSTEDDAAAATGSTTPAALNPVDYTNPTAAGLARPMPILIAIGLSVFGTILFGALPPATQVLDLRATAGANQEGTGLSVYEQDAPDAEDAAVSATATPATSPAPR